LVLATIRPAHGQGASNPIFELDLQSLQQRFLPASYKAPLRYTHLAFLSDDLLLVSVTPVSGNSPLSAIVLFDVARRDGIRTAFLPIHERDTVLPASNQRFLVLGSSGLQVCSVELACGPLWPARGPLRVSPRGTRAVVAGVRPLEQWMIDIDQLSALTEPHDWSISGPPIIAGGQGSLTDFAWIVPGDLVWLSLQPSGIILQMPEGREVDLGFGSASRNTTLEMLSGPKLLAGSKTGLRFNIRTQFLNQDTIIGVNGRKATTVTAEGRILYHIPLNGQQINFISSASGLRFGIKESWYGGLDSMIDSGDESGGYNRARLRIFEVSAGRQLFELKWNPRYDPAHDVNPVLSPSGGRLAIVRKKKLQIYDLR
jgi:hypothetical protein